MKPWLFTNYKSFRKIRLVNGTRLFGSWVPAEKLREQPNIPKGSPIFADGMLQTEIRVPFLIPVPGFRGRFSVDGTDLCKRKTRFRKEISSIYRELTDRFSNVNGDDPKFKPIFRSKQQTSEGQSDL